MPKEKSEGKKTGGVDVRGLWSEFRRVGESFDGEPSAPRCVREVGEGGDGSPVKGSDRGGEVADRVRESDSGQYRTNGRGARGR